MDRKLPRTSSNARGLTGELPRRTLVEQVRGILATKDLTLYRAAALVRLRYPQQSAYQLPHNFYFQLQSAGLTPTLHQLSALAELSDLRLEDWLRIFGFRLDDIACVQAALPRPRTALLDGTVQHTQTTIPWFRDRPAGAPAPPVAPLSQLLAPSGAVRLSSLPFSGTTSRFRYAKIGQQDALAFPDLAPGSIVRADAREVSHYLRPTSLRDSDRIFLVEHHRGVCCSRLHFGAGNRVTLLPTELPFANVEFELGSEARILGLLDLEIRPLTHAKKSARPICSQPEVAPDLARLWTPGLLAGTGARPAHVLRDARLRAALSLRAASKMSRDIAQMLGNKRYFTSQGSLSDYEANDTPPRHIQKLLTLSILYALPFNELLAAFAIDLSRDADPIPDEWMSDREGQDRTLIESVPVSGFLARALEHLGELPFFLHGSLASLSGLSDISLLDIFWVGGQSRALHPALAGALFIIVNRRNTTPPVFRRKSLWEQPLYVVRRRDESYLLANCTQEDHSIVVHPHAAGFVPHERLRNRVDAEVLGQIVAVVRSVLPQPAGKATGPRSAGFPS